MLLRACRWELVEANIFFRLHTDLVKTGIEYADEMDQSWTLGRHPPAHLDAAMFRAGKIFDRDTGNFGLRGLLHTMRANPRFRGARAHSHPNRVESTSTDA